MPIGLVSDDQFNSEISKNQSVQTTEIKIIPKSGRNGQLEVPQGLRKLLGETNELESRQDALELAKHFGISSSSVSAYAKGSTSTKTYKEGNTDLRNHINQAKERISKKARNRLIHALNEITPQKLAEAKLQTVSSVAKDMSAIVKNLEPDVVNDNSGGMNSPTFVIYSPQFKREDQFDSIVVNE